jgi:hypothetical protein
MNRQISLLVFILSLVGSSAWAFIPKASMILSRTAENSGKGIYQIEQEVQFASGAETLVLKETWIIENENNMRLMVTGGKELKDLVSFQVSYVNGLRSQNGQTRRLNDDFIEKYFHVRSVDSMAQILASLKIVPNSVLAKKPVKIGKEADYQAENFIRLSRVGGVVTYSLGMSAESETLRPAFWIEQDQFLIRKFRLPSLIEVSADKYNTYARGLSFPGSRNVKWDNQQVSIQTISVKAVGKEALSAFAAKAAVPAKFNIGQFQAASAIEDFYERLR